MNRLGRGYEIRYETIDSLGRSQPSFWLGRAYDARDAALQFRVEKEEEVGASQYRFRIIRIQPSDFDL